MKYKFAKTETVTQNKTNGAVYAPEWITYDALTLDEAVRRLEKRIGSEEVGRRGSSDAKDGFAGAGGQVVTHCGHVRLANGDVYAID